MIPINKVKASFPFFGDIQDHIDALMVELDITPLDMRSLGK